MAVIEIDQSGKWETSKPTVIGVSIGNKITHTALITSQDKNLARRFMGGIRSERCRSKKSMILRMFTFTVFLAIEKIYRAGDTLVIDVEYEGQDTVIRDLIVYLFKKNQGLDIDPMSITFALVGKQSLAHKIALSTFNNDQKPDKIIDPSEYYRLIDKTEEIRKKAFLKRKERNQK